jgi:hypothetical protein
LTWIGEERVELAGERIVVRFPWLPKAVAYGVPSSIGRKTRRGVPVDVSTVPDTRQSYKYWPSLVGVRISG